MLQTIREHTQGWIAGTIISIIILSFVLWGVHSYFIGGTVNVNVAEVNGIPITKEQLAVAYERMRRQVQIQYGNNYRLAAKEETALKKRALQTLIDIEVLKQASYAQGFRVYDPQIDNYLQSMPDFQVNGRFSVERLQEVLSSTLLSTSEFLELIKTSLLIDQPKLGIILSSFALPDETTYTVALVNQERDIAYLNIPLQQTLSQPVMISSQQIEQYYKQHKRDFMTPEQVNVEYITLSLNALSANIKPTDIAIKHFYNDNINSYTQPMQWKFITLRLPVKEMVFKDEATQINKKMEAISAALKKGADINQLAKTYNGQVKSFEWLTLNQVPPEFQKAVAQLVNAGQVSAPFKTTDALVIIKAEGVQGPKMQDFESVKEKVKEAYIHQHAEEKMAEMREQLADLTYEHPDSLQTAAKTLNVPIQTSELFSKDKPGQGIAEYKKVREIAFSNDVLNLQNNSDVIQLNPETMIVLRVKSHVAAALLPLSNVKQQIESKLKIEKAEAALASFTTELKSKLASGADPKQLAAIAKLQWTDAGFIGRYSTKVDSAILDLAFRLPHPSTTSPITYDVTRIPGGYAIVALKSVRDGRVTDKNSLIFTEQIQTSEGILEYELYKQAQIRHAKIKLAG